MSDASVGSIIGYLKLDRSDWDAELNAAGRKADELGRHSPNIKIATNAPSAIAQLAAVAAAVKRLQDAQGAENVAQAKLTELQNRGNASSSQLAAAEERLQRAHRATASATIGLAAAHDKNNQAMRRAAADQDQLAQSSNKSSFQMHALRDAILLIGPAAVPIAAVAGGAILGLVPVAAAAILGIKGISDEYKSGALAGTQYGADIKSLANEFTNLKQTAANGMLGGIDQAIQSSQPLFSALNQDVGTLSSQLGSIVAGAAPALLTILNALNPLFVTFGNLLSDGAAKLEHWATSSGGIQSFVAYVQAELPTVITALGQLIETAGRLLAALAPMGHVILSGIGTLASVLNAIPTNVLSVLATGALSLYAAFRTYGAITAIVNGVTNAVNAMKAPFVTTAAAANASTLEMEATQLEAAAAIAESNAVIAESAAQSAVDQAAAAEEAGAADVRLTQLIAENAIEQAAAFRATAVAAAASAATIRGEATVAAETVVTEGKVAAVGWMSMLGPIAAVVVGVGLLAATLTHHTDAAKLASEAEDSYAQSMRDSTDALSAENVQQTISNLQKAGAFSALDKLRQGNQSLGITYNDLTNAVNGSDAQFDGVIAKLHAAGGASGKNGAAVLALVGALSTMRDGLGQARVAQDQANAASTAATSQIDRQNAAAAKLYGLVGTDGVAAYLAAKQAAQQNTDQAKAQTLAWQMENNAGSLLQQTLDKLAGKNLSYAQAQNQFQQALVNQAKHTTAADAALKGMSSSAIKNRGDLLGIVTQAQQTADAYGNLKDSTEAGRLKLIQLRKQIIDNAVAHGEDRKAVTAYIDSVLKVPKKTTTDMQTKTDKANAALAALQAKIDSIKQGKVPGLAADTLLARERIQDLQNQIDALHGKSIQVNVSAPGVVGVNGGQDLKVKPHRASGGTVPGTGDADDTLISATPGEEVINKRQSQKHRALLKAINNGTYDPEHHRTGGTVGGDIATLTPKKSKAKGSKGKSGGSRSSKVAVTVNASDLTSFLRSLPTFVSTAATAVSDQFQTLISKVAQAGGGTRLVDRLRKENASLVGLVRDRDSVGKQLAAAQTVLNNAVQKYDAEKSSVSGAITGTFNVSSVQPSTSSKGFASGVAGVSTSVASTTVGLGSILTQLSQAVGNAKRFDQVLRSLAKKGLSPVLLDQLAQAGPAALAQALALDSATSGQLSGINKQEASLIHAANDAGKFMADRMDGAGVQAALGLVHGLQSQDKALAAAMKHLADVMVRQIRKELKIHSPSLVMHELGAFTGQGFANGIGSQADTVRAQSMRLAGVAVPSINRASTGGGSGGLQLVQHIYPQAEQSPLAIARAAAAEQVWALRR